MENTPATADIVEPDTKGKIEVSDKKNNKLNEDRKNKEGENTFFSETESEDE